MTPEDFLREVQDPGFVWMDQLKAVGVYRPDNGPKARLALCAFAGQETQWVDEAQIGGGPGRGPWQFESETCRELMDHPTSRSFLYAAANDLSVQYEEAAIYGALLTHPLLAVTCARLDLLCYPHPIPKIGDEDGCWVCYLRVWRPGKPDRVRFGGVYRLAMIACGHDPALVRQSSAS